MADGIDMAVIERRLEALEMLPRAVFLLHRVDGLDYAGIV